VNPALLSLLALLAAIALSCFTPINVGFLSIALAFLIGHFAAGMKLSEVMAGFPVSMFLTLTGVMLLFAQSSVNGTLDQVAKRSVRLARGNRGMVPVLFFVLAVVLGASGPGGIAAAALLAPVAMGIAGELGIPAFLMTLMVANGANAGTFSPIAPTGIIARELMAKIGLAGMEWPNFWNTLVAQSLIAFGGYLLLGGAALLRSSSRIQSEPDMPAFTPAQKMTLFVITVLVAGVIFFRVDVGVASFVAASVLAVARAASDEAAIKAMPWGVIALVCGVTMLIHVMNATGGMDLFSGILANLSGPRLIPGMMALVTGIISVYSSSSGVVLPAFLPTIPGLIERLGGGDPLRIAYSINVGSHLVDVSPLSTIGAMCLACAPVTEDRSRLFRKLLLWGWSMALVGAIVCQVLFG
jgi:di/tricarboxylate transporter